MKIGGNVPKRLGLFRRASSAASHVTIKDRGHDEHPVGASLGASFTFSTRTGDVRRGAAGQRPRGSQTANGSKRRSRAALVLLLAAGFVTPILTQNSPRAYAAGGPSVIGDVYTIVGNGTAGTSGNGGQATEAELSTPLSSTIDASGNLYVADNVNNRVQEVAGTTHSQWGISMTAGDVYTIAGSASGSSGTSGDGGAATSALLAGPAGVALDASGNLYIADGLTNNRVQFVAASTCSSSCPWGLASTMANDIYTIAGSSSSYGSSGDGGPATSALLYLPRSVTLDTVGNLYIADEYNNRVQFVAASTCSSSCPWGLASTTANDIYTVAGSASGTSGQTGDGGAATSGLFN